VITIADTLDAMTTIRPYRPARSLDEVREEIARVAGIQFDPRLCAALLADEKWDELCLEVEIASREYPADGSHVDPESVLPTRHSMQFRAP
jgi:response regulator RpfG family c-di-GMP phosphodiesterase